MRRSKWIHAYEEDEKVLTAQMLDIMPADTRFATGEAPDSPEGINMTNSGKMLRWVAVSGHNGDWSIYIGLASETIEYVARHGDKLLDRDNIQRCVTCDSGAMRRYRR